MHVGVKGNDLASNQTSAVPPISANDGQPDRCSLNSATIQMIQRPLVLCGGAIGARGTAGESSATVDVVACRNCLDQSIFPIEAGREPVSPILAITARIVSLPIGFWIGGHNLRPWRAASRCKASRSHGLPLLINCTMPS